MLKVRSRTWLMVWEELKMPSDIGAAAIRGRITLHLATLSSRETDCVAHEKYQ